MNATWPFAKLVANSDELTLRVLVLKYSFPKASIVRISEYAGPLAGVLPRFITSGLRIEHRNKNVPDFVVFWTPHSSDLFEAARFNGISDELMRRLRSLRSVSPVTRLWGL